MVLKERVDEAKRIAEQEIKEEELKRKNKRKFGGVDDEDDAVKNKIGKVQHKKKKGFKGRR